MQLNVEHAGVWIPWVDKYREKGSHEEALLEQVAVGGWPMKDAVLVGEGLGPDRFGLFGRERMVGPKSKTRFTLPYGVPVFADYPQAKGFEMAVERARGSVLAVLEGPGLELSGWAAAVGAVDALTGEPAPPLPDVITKNFDRLLSAGYNSFTGAKYNSTTRIIVPEIAAEIRAAGYSNDFIVSYLMAAGLSKDGADNLRKLITR